MQAADFTKDAPGRLVKTVQGHEAFLPDPLPPKRRIGEGVEEEFASVLSAANLALGKLSGIAQTLANPHLLIRPYVRREAVLSSRIEGTRADLFDLYLFEADPASAAEQSDIQEVHNYVSALEYGLSQLAVRPLGLALLLEMQQLLLKSAPRSDDPTPGLFRDRQVFIGRSNLIEHATFVPPPPELLRDCLEPFERYLQEPSTLPPLVRLALIHYQFETIHPFNDGNGRLGRLLITLMLCVDGLLPHPLLYLSAYLEAHRQEYFRHLLHVSQRAAWTDWVIFFLTGVKESASDAVERSDRLVALREDYRQRVARSGSSARLLELIDQLFSTPALTAQTAAAAMNVGPRQGLNQIKKLMDLGIVREATGKRRNRIFVASGIVTAVDEHSRKLR